MDKLMARIGRVTAAVLVAGGIAMSAGPTQAASVGFGISIGDGEGNSITFGAGSDGGGVGLKIRGGCWSVQQVRRALREDFYDLDYIGQNGRRVIFEGTSRDDDEDYRIRVNRCTGEVSLRPL